MPQREAAAVSGPRLDPRLDCIENGEPATVNILMRWTRSMVVTLQEVDGTFNPIF